MAREVHLSDLDAVLEEFDYPCSRTEAADHGQDVTLLLADGTENLGAVIANSSADEFASVEELSSEVLNVLPRHAVGEPYQSEGEG